MTVEDKVSKLTPKMKAILGWLPKLGSMYRTSEEMKIHDSVTHARNWHNGKTNNPSNSSIGTYCKVLPVDRTIFITKITLPSRLNYPVIIEFMPNQHEDEDRIPTDPKIWIQCFLIYPPDNITGYPVWQYFLTLIEPEQAVTNG